MGFPDAIFVIKKLSKLIKGVPQTYHSTGTSFSGNAGSYQTVFDVTGAGEVNMLYIMGASAQGTGTDSVTFRWSYRITIDGEVLTPPPTIWSDWKIDGGWWTYFSTPLRASPVSSSSSYNSTRNWYLTPLSTMPNLSDTLPIKFSKSCKVEIYFAQATTVNVAYRVTYNQR